MPQASCTCTGAQTKETYRWASPVSIVHTQLARVVRGPKVLLVAVVQRAALAGIPLRHMQLLLQILGDIITRRLGRLDGSHLGRHCDEMNGMRESANRAKLNKTTPPTAVVCADVV